VIVDIRPNDVPNPVQIGSRGVIPVAVLGSDDFDASAVDRTSLRFGPAAAPAIHTALKDVNGDGILDLLGHFRTRATGIAAGDTEACLGGQTLAGESFMGCDAIVTVPWSLSEKRGPGHRIPDAPPARRRLLSWYLPMQLE
jgi:hypothetical protein